jgi:hypothetical protein
MSTPPGEDTKNTTATQYTVGASSGSTPRSRIASISSFFGSSDRFTNSHAPSTAAASVLPASSPALRDEDGLIDVADANGALTSARNSKKRRRPAAPRRSTKRAMHAAHGVRPGTNRDAGSDDAGSDPESGEDLEDSAEADHIELVRGNAQDAAQYDGQDDDWVGPGDITESDGEREAQGAFHHNQMQDRPLQDLSRTRERREHAAIAANNALIYAAFEDEEEEDVEGSHPHVGSSILRATSHASGSGNAVQAETIPRYSPAGGGGESGPSGPPGDENDSFSRDFCDPDDDEKRASDAADNARLENSDGCLHDPTGTKLIELVREYYAIPSKDRTLRQLYRLLRHLERKWTMAPGMTVTDFAHLRYGINVNNLHDLSIDVGSILNEQFQFFHCEAIAIYRLFGTQSWGEGHKNYKIAEQVFNKVMKQIYDLSMMLYFEHSYFSTTLPPRSMALPPFNPWQFRIEKAKDYTGIIKLMHFLLRRLQQLNLRKRGGTIQQEVLIDGKRTGHWTTCGTIQEWVLKGLHTSLTHTHAAT